jgi:hypothetical protein
MGVFSKPFTFVGREFRNEKAAIAYFQSKYPMTQEDLDEMGPRLHYWMDERQKQGFPKCGLYSIFTGDEERGYYIGYNVYDKDPKKMIEKINKACDDWKKMFDEEPQILQTILYT